MKVFTTQFSVKTSKRADVVKITDQLAKAVQGAGVSEGIATVSALHTTCALTINEAEPLLLEDIKEFFAKILPEGGGYRHDQIDDNAHAHLRSMLLNPTIVIPVHRARPMLGTWQSVLLIESDGPRERTILVQIIGT